MLTKRKTREEHSFFEIRRIKIERIVTLDHFTIFVRRTRHCSEIKFSAFAVKSVEIQ